MSSQEEDEGVLDELSAKAMAEQLVQQQETSKDTSRKAKEGRAKLLEWMEQHEKKEIDVGVGIAEVRETKQMMNPNDLMFMTLRGEPYNWSETEIEDFVQNLASTKEHLAEIKHTLKIRIARKKGKRQGKRKTMIETDTVITPVSEK